MTFAVGFNQYLDHFNVKRVKGRLVSDDYRRQTKQCFNRFSSLHKIPLTEIDSKMVAAGTSDFPNIHKTLKEASEAPIETPTTTEKTEYIVTTLQQQTGAQALQDDLNRHAKRGYHYKGSIGILAIYSLTP